MTRTNRMRTTRKTLAALCATYLQQPVLKHRGSPKPEFLKLGSVEPQCSVKVCQWFRDTKMRNGERVYWRS